jgi:HPt (histidine-containing phosphotransfer) domain-containing protein
VADVLDRAVLDELRASVGGDDGFLAELIDEFLGDAPRQLAALRASVDSADAPGARRAAHTLKGNGRTFGAATFSALCQLAEARAAADDLEAVRSGLAEIEAAWSDVRDALVAERDHTA